MPRGRQSNSGIPGISQSADGRYYYAQLAGDDLAMWRERYPDKTPPRRRVGSLREAVEAQRELIADLRRNRQPRATNPALTEYLEAWLDTQHHISDQMRRLHRWVITSHIKPRPIGKRKLNQLTPAHVDNWVADLLAYRTEADQPLSAYSIRSCYATLRTALNAAVSRQLIDRNPCMATLPQPPDQPFYALELGQVQQLLAYLRQAVDGQPHRLTALYALAVYCGLRKGELLGLQVGDISLSRGEVRVERQAQGTKLVRVKSAASRRTISLGAALPDVRWHLANLAEEQALGGQAWNISGLLFPSTVGTVISARNLSRDTDKILERAGLHHVRFHDFRHTYASLSLAAGVDLFALSKLMGHSNIDITVRRYGHLYEQHRQLAATQLQNYIAKTNQA